LDKSKFRVKIDEIGIEPAMSDSIKDLLGQPHGIVLVTGPTGSGKTTTVYAMLSQINEAGSNIITVEDPVEYQFDIINQVQVNPKAGLHFADLLRNILRHDPDVIMVGEIRDKETADTAIRSALTGHLVISTIHTNDSVSTVHRLMDMGVEPFLIGSAVLAIMSQRLVRSLCPFCKQEQEVTADLLATLPPGIRDPSWVGRKWFKASGCDECRQTGYRGRFAIAELFVPDDEMRRAITERASKTEILRYIEKNGFRSMRLEALNKVWSGQTSIDEIIRNTI
ncbi:MAG: GspE/PulE family protein, partial [Bdellovibrionales bacterium]|nr:GspE/PulE family protein [Bdellovibrionales bacterium]